MPAMLGRGVVLGVALLVQGVAAIFEEEAGVNDWKRENIGRLKSLVHPKAKSGVQRNKAFVITEAGTLAALDLASGATAWRQTLPGAPLPPSPTAPALPGSNCAFWAAPRCLPRGRALQRALPRRCLAPPARALSTHPFPSSHPRPKHTPRTARMCMPCGTPFSSAAADQFDLVRLHNRNVLTLSGGGKIVRLWNAQDGTLQWDGRVCSCSACPETPSRFDAVFVGTDTDGDGAPRPPPPAPRVPHMSLGFGTTHALALRAPGFSTALPSSSCRPPRPCPRRGRGSGALRRRRGAAIWRRRG
jgi:hypothetical protein